METVLRADGIYKSYGNSMNFALEDVDFNVYKGKVNVLIGENGAGKSTLIKIFSGAHQLTKGQLYVDEKPVSIKSVQDAYKYGIATVYQELSLVPGLTVAENIFLGTDLITNSAGVVKWNELIEKTREVLVDVLNMDSIDPRAKVSSLGIAQQQMIEIARVMRKKPKVLILDEPTAVLTDKEIKKLFQLIASMKEKAVSIVYISHRLEELFEIGDYISVFRDGKKVSENCVTDITTDELIEKMVGREIKDQYPKEDFSHVEIKELLQVEHLSTKDKIRDVSFTARTGEILGFAGLVGAGRTEIARAIFGADKNNGGKIFIDGKEISINGIGDAIQNGIALVSENRKEEGLNLMRSIRENISIVKLKKLTKIFGIIDMKKEKEEAERKVKELRILTRDSQSAAGSLSGGNQQKVVIAKWLSAEPKVIILDEPTRGIDVGAKTEVYQIMNNLVKQGKVVIMISSDMMELIGVCQRILTVKDGRITAEFRTPVEQDVLLKAMMEGEQ